MGYEVVVGNVGAVYSGTDKRQALRVYRRHVEDCLSRQEGRGFVTLFAGGVPRKEYDGEIVRRGINVG